MSQTNLPTTVRATKRFKISNAGEAIDFAQDFDIDFSDLIIDIGVFTSSMNGLVPTPNEIGTVKFLREDGTWQVPAGSGSGSVTDVSVVTANGVSGTVATSTTTPAITITLGAITPTSVASVGTVTGSNLSGTNTGDQVITLTGDVTGTGGGSFATTIGANKVHATMLNADVFGTSGSTACIGNDSRLSDARTPVGTALTSTDIWVGNGSNLAAAVAMTGDITISNTGVTAIGANKVHATMLNADVFGASGTTACVGNDARLSDARTPVGTALTSANIWLGNGSNVAAAAAMTGDVTITNAGVTAIGSNKVTFAKIAQVAALTLVANPTGSTANLTSIGLGNGLDFAGGGNLEVTFGATSVTACVGNDSRLSDARTPVGTALTSADIWVGNGSNLAAQVAVTGDVTLTNAGLVTITKVLNNLPAPTGSLSLNSQKITNLLDPTSLQDAATKNYVDAQVALLAIKKECQVATTAALAASTYANGTAGVGATLTLNVAAVLVLDGYTVFLNDRLLIKNQADATENGIYTVTTLGTGSVQAVLTRATDFNVPTDGINGAFTFIQNGTVNVSTGWLCTTYGSITFGHGNTSINWTQDTGSGTYTGTAPISVNASNQISVSTGSTGSTVCIGNDSRLSDARTPVGTALTSANIWLGNGSNLAAAVAITGDISITNAGLTAIGANKVHATMLNSDVFGTSGSTACVGNDSRLNDARTPVGTALTNTDIWVGNGSNLAAAVAVTGDITISNAGVTAIGANKVTYGQMQQASTITLLGNPTGGTANVSEVTLGAGLSFTSANLNANQDCSAPLVSLEILANSTTTIFDDPYVVASGTVTIIDSGGLLNLTLTDQFTDWVTSVSPANVEVPPNSTLTIVDDPYVVTSGTVTVLDTGALLNLTVTTPFVDWVTTVATTNVEIPPNSTLTIVDDPYVIPSNTVTIIDPTGLLFLTQSQLQPFLASTIAVADKVPFNAAATGLNKTDTAEDLLLLMGRGYIDGCTIAYSDPTNVSFGSGVCASATGIGTIRLMVQPIGGLRKGIGSSFLPGDQFGGLFTGVVRAINTWYHCFIIRKDSDGSIEAGFDTSITAANIPSGYTAYRRVGSVLTDGVGSGSLIQWKQYGDEFWWVTSPKDIDVTAPAITATSYTLSTPTGVKTRAMMNVIGWDSAVYNFMYMSSLDQTDSVGSFTTGFETVVNSTATEGVAAYVSLWTNTNSQIRARSRVANATMQFRVLTLGWFDLRGRNL